MVLSKSPDQSPSLERIIDVFIAQSYLSENFVALEYQGQQMLYSQLREKVLALAGKLAGIPDSFIGISNTRGIDTIIGVLAIIRSGKAYLPIDVSFPAERLQQIIQDAGLSHALFPVSESAFFEKELHLKNAAESQSDSPASISGLVYVLYTSGSTGKPKGICMGEKGPFNLINWQNKNSHCGLGTKTLQFSPLGFDVSFQEIFATLTSGGTLVLINDDQRLNALGLLEFINTHQVNRIFVPFVALQLLSEAAVAQGIFPASLQEIMTAGEQLKITPQLRAFFSQIPDCKLINQYGPTEAHVVTQLVMEGLPDSWPNLPNIGKPIDNTQAFILDESKRLVADGTEGELCLAGDCLAEGYLNLPELTAEKFEIWQHPQQGAIRIYHTGDTARVLPDGNIEFLGRNDDQVKIRGYRIELGEIEAALNKLPEVKQAVVVVNKDIPSQNRMIAYVQTDQQSLPLRQQLAATLPDYMLPSGFVLVTEFSRTPNGKIDKKALPIPTLQRPALATPYKRPVTPVEKQLVTLWEELLQLQPIGADDNFFELGGNSLLAQKTVTLLQQQASLKLPITKLYQYPSASGISAYFSGKEKKLAVPVKTSRSAQKDVAIIGMACRFPGADTIDDFWKILVNGEESIRYFTPEEIDASIPAQLKNDAAYVAARGVINNAQNFDAGFFGLTPAMAEVMDPQQRIFLEIAYEALENSGCLPSVYNGKVGVFAGTGINTYYLNNVISHTDKIATLGQFQVNTVADKDYIATRTAYQLNLDGPAVTVLSACSTSLLAVAQAMESIRTGQCTVAVAGAASITAPIASGHLYQEGAMLSKDGHTRSFDATANGTVFSDGAGVVVLKDLEEAEKDGDTIFAVLKGAGVNNDGAEKSSFTAPSAHGQATAIATALSDANVSAADISYIEAHGTATPVGDPIEMEGLKLAFGDQAKANYCAVASVKSNFGHLTHASGVAGLIKTVLAMQHGQLPASLHFTQPNPALGLEGSPFYINHQLLPWQQEKKLAGVSSFGVGGTNVHVVLQNYPAKPTPVIPANEWQLITWSAHSEWSSLDYATKLAKYIHKNPATSIEAIAATLQNTRKEFFHKKAVVAKDAESLVAALQDTISIKKQTAVNGKKEIVFVFPGQGTHYAGMGGQLYQTYPVFKAAFEECRNILLQITGADLLAVALPDNLAYAPEKLNDTLYAQPAIFTVSYALAKLWMSLGVEPQYFIGHSLGEFVAAHLAGIFSLQDALQIISTRSRLVSQLPNGSMLAVRLGDQSVETLLEEGIAHALANSVQNHVFAGSPEKIDRFTEKIKGLGLAHAPVNTSHAFHSPGMDPVIAPLQQLIASMQLQAPRIPVISSVTGQYLKDSEATSAAYWAQHLRETVQFSDATSFALEHIDPLFLECGPGNVLSSYIRQQDKAASCVESITPNHPESKQWLQAVGKLWQNGHSIIWEKLYNQTPQRLVNLPGYAFQRKKYWLEPLTNPTLTLTETIINSQQIPAEATTFMEELNPSPAPAPVSASPVLSERKSLLAGKLRQILENTLGIQVADSEDNLSFIELGVDSLLLTQLALTLKKEFSVPVTLRQLSEDEGSIRALANYLDQHLPAEKQVPAPVVTNAAPSFEPAPAPTPAPTAIVVPQPLPQAVPVMALETNASLPLQMIAQQLQLLTQQVQLLGGQTNVSIPAAAPVNTSAPAVQHQTAPSLSIARQGLQVSAEEAAELKKPFGATARIERQSIVIGDAQKAFIEDFADRYNKKTLKSKQYTQQNRAAMADPRVVTGFKPATKEIVYPIVVSSSKGSRLKDLDGNDYIDALNGFGSNMLGYQPDILKNAIIGQIEKGYEVGPQHELAGPVCNLLCEFTQFDRAALCNTGSEAVLGAIRIARTVTGRSLIVSFSGSYHGINDEVLVRGTKRLQSFPAAPGIMPGAVENILVLDYGTDESLKIIEERAHELAAVLVEPVQSRRPEFQPVDFLKKLREITLHSGTVLVFDEVITGFRMHPGGTQAMFGIKADLGTYGKVIGGGLPIGAIAGKKHLMDALDGGFWQFGDDSTPEVGVTYFAGTFVRHPLALAAAKASLEYMKMRGKALQDGLNGNTKYLADALNEICLREGAPVYVVYFGSLWKIKFKEEYPYSELLFALMRFKGIHIWDNFPCFLTEAHSKADIDQIIHQFETSLQELIKEGLVAIPAEKKAVPNAISSPDDNQPPVSGARLGLDEENNPAWFIRDNKKNGFLKVETLQAN